MSCHGLIVTLAGQYSALQVQMFWEDSVFFATDKFERYDLEWLQSPMSQPILILPAISYNQHNPYFLNDDSVHQIGYLQWMISASLTKLTLSIPLVNGDADITWQIQEQEFNIMELYTVGHCYSWQSSDQSTSIQSARVSISSVMIPSSCRWCIHCSRAYECSWKFPI